MEEYLLQYFGAQKGAGLWEKTRLRLRELLKTAEPCSRQQKKVLRNLLLPRIALYQVLQEEGISKEEAGKVLFDNMVQCNARPMRKKYEKMDSLPFAYWMFRLGFTRIVASSDLWEAEINTESREDFTVTMHRCFWHDTFQAYGCPEMCRFACQCDDITYSDLKRIGYGRTQTLGTGGNYCDFHFWNRKKEKE